VHITAGVSSILPCADQRLAFHDLQLDELKMIRSNVKSVTSFWMDDCGGKNRCYFAWLRHARVQLLNICILVSNERIYNQRKCIQHTNTDIYKCLRNHIVNTFNLYTSEITSVNLPYLENESPWDVWTIIRHHEVGFGRNCWKRFPSLELFPKAPEGNLSRNAYTPTPLIRKSLIRNESLKSSRKNVLKTNKIQ